MLLGVASHLFFNDRLNPAYLDTLHHAGAQCIEIFASRHHFDYTNRNALRELALWFRSNPVQPTMHMPLFTEAEEAEWSRHTQPTLNLVARSKRDRIIAMDEVKRALEAAEQIPFASCVLHLGLKDDKWSTESLDLSMTAIEHLKAFATPLGVQLLLENLPSDLATPAHLVEVTRAGHFDNVGFCLDTGHAHLATPLQPGETGFDRSARERLREHWGDAALKDALPEAFAIFGSRLIELHLHDNHGTRDEHLWPGDAAADKGIDWGLVTAALRDLPTTSPRGILEIAYEPATPTRDLENLLRKANKRINPDTGN